MSIKKSCLFFLFLFLNSCIHTTKPLVTSVSLKDLELHRLKKIPKKIHQVWVGGSKVPDFYYVFLESFKNNAPDYEYKLWTNKDLTPENFPLTYSSIMRIVEEAKQKYGRNDNNWKGLPSIKAAAVADLVRYEIIYHHGGFYFDVKSELLKPINLINPSEEDISFVVANEDPCGLKCTRIEGYYLANAFFGAAPGSPLLKNLLLRENLKRRDFMHIRTDLETGPGYFGKVFPKEVRDNPRKYGVLVLNNKTIFPLIDWISGYQFPSDNLCMSPNKEELKKRSDEEIISFPYKGRTLHTIFPCDQYPDSVSICHWGYIGRSWQK